MSTRLPPWARRWPFALGAIFTLALLWRLSYLVRLSHSALGGSLSEDSLIYWRWSGFLLQRGLWGKNPFFMGPLYPYSLALVRPLVGNSMSGVLVAQALGGAAAAALLADAARRLSRPAIGVFVGLLVATYEMAVFLDGLVLMESLLFFLEAGLIWWVARTDWRAHRALPLVVAGALIGLIAEGRASSAVLLLPALAFVALPSRDGWSARARASALLLAGFVAVAAPAALRNYAVSREWIPFTYNGGVNLYLGNNDRATGGFTSPVGTHIVGAAVGGGEDGGAEADTRDYLRKAEHLDLGPNASSEYWARKGRAFIAAHPAAAARLAARKMVMMWNRREYPQIENVDEFRAVAGPVGLPLIGTFAFVGALAFGGLLVGWRRGPAGRFLAGYAVVMTLAVAPFFVTDRYRHHLVPAAAVLAGLCLDELVQGWRRGRTRAQGPVSAALLAGVVLVNLPAPQLGRAKYDWGLAFDMGTRWAERRRFDLAIGEYEKAVHMESEHLVTLDPSERGDLYYDYANALSRGGRGSEAVAWYERAVRAAPDHALAVQALANARLAAGRIAEAESLFAALENKAGGHSLALQGRARLAASRGRLDEAERLFRQVVTESPTQYSAWGGLMRAQVEQGDLREAAATLAAARQAGLPAPASHAYEGLLAALARDRAGAERALAAVPPSAIAEDPTLADVVRITRGLLGSR